MSEKYTSKAIILLIFAVIFSMNQQTPAQSKKPKVEKTPVVEVKAVPPEISYTVSMSKPWTHLLEIEMSVKWAQMPDKVDLKMPVWTPGSYLVREYARHVEKFGVKAAGGSALTWSKANKNTWQVDTKGAKEIVVNYLVYANELTVRTNEFNDETGIWKNGPALLFFTNKKKVTFTA